MAQTVKRLQGELTTATENQVDLRAQLEASATVVAKTEKVKDRLQQHIQWSKGEVEASGVSMMSAGEGPYGDLDKSFSS